jgi:hypothetical protein
MACSGFWAAVPSLWCPGSATSGGCSKIMFWVGKSLSSPLLRGRPRPPPRGGQALPKNTGLLILSSRSTADNGLAFFAC